MSRRLVLIPALAALLAPLVPALAAPATAAPDASATPTPDSSAPMTHREVLETLSGLLLGMFVAILSSTVVSNALPRIVADLEGTESGYTWIVTATLLATTISTPIWGKLADLTSKKRLVQVALGIFTVSSMIAGLAQNMETLIAMRVFQGIGAGGLTALSQVILASIVSPRERGRYSGYLGATFALGTVAGPLIGGAITEHLSWRWCFYVGVPFAIAAAVVLQKTLHLPTIKRPVRIDYLGAMTIAGGVSLLLVWVSLAGHQFDWASWETAVMVPGGIALLALCALVAPRLITAADIAVMKRGSVIVDMAAAQGGNVEGSVADEVVVMSEGRVVQAGTPQSLFDRPEHTFVGYFIGSPGMNLLEGRVSDDGSTFEVAGNGPKLPLQGVASIGQEVARGREWTLGIRPEHMTPGQADAAHATLTVDSCELLGADNLAHGRWGKHDVTVRLPHTHRPAAGEALQVALPARHLHFFDPSTGRRAN